MASPASIVQSFPSRHRTRTSQTLVRALSASLAKDQATGQASLFDAAADGGAAEEDAAAGEQSVFRHGVKARTMAHGIPVQLVWQETLEGTATVEDDATCAWNFWAGVYYKAGGTPWRVTRLERGRPMLADSALGRKIIDDVAKRSASWGTKLTFENGVGRVVLIPAQPR